MKTNHPVAWHEGMFLCSHHFQQQDRFLRHIIHQNAIFSSPYYAGVYEYSIDKELLKSGKFSLKNIKGILPNGMPFELPEDGDLPAPIEISTESAGDTVYFAIAKPNLSSPYVVNKESSRLKTAGYIKQIIEVIDYNEGDSREETVDVLMPHFQFILGSDEHIGYEVLSISKVVEVTADKNLIMDKNFIPPSLCVLKNDQLKSYAIEILGMLNQRAEALALRYSQESKTVNTFVDFSLLQIINHNIAHLHHLTNTPVLHPEKLFLFFATLLGDLAPFYAKERRIKEQPIYNHDDLYNTFKTVVLQLSNFLSSVLEQTAVSLPIEEKRYGVRVGRISDRNLVDTAEFILAAKAGTDTESLRTLLPAQIKIGPVEQISTLVNNQLRGINIEPLPVAPRQIPIRGGFNYFRLNKQNNLWNKLKDSGGLALHVSGNFPDLEIEIWAIRQS